LFISFIFFRASFGPFLSLLLALCSDPRLAGCPYSFAIASALSAFSAQLDLTVPHANLFGFLNWQLFRKSNGRQRRAGMAQSNAVHAQHSNDA
jgi:hypothetical protein